MEKLSIIIITKNEEKNIGRCIDSVRSVADEIIVVDSFSSDRTVAIAESKGAIVKQLAFDGYIEQKNKAVEMAAHNYILSLDADEELNPPLIDSIKKTKTNFETGAYRMNRCSIYCGRPIRHGSWYPDSKIRLFDRRIAYWGGTNPHDKIVLKNDTGVTNLKGDILHYSYSSISEHVLQNNKFSSIAAESLFADGKKTNVFKILVHPAWAFFLSYILRAGFLDGLDGLVISYQISYMTFLKHFKLYVLCKSVK